jgi:GNAT superfamily N-acetyltransferase
MRFCSTVEPLDDWLKRLARHNEAEGGSRTFVLCAGDQVIGYYSLATGSLLVAEATGRVKRNMPSPVPVILLGRLAIDKHWQGRGLGSDLLRDAMLRVTTASESVGIRAILVHAISDAAKTFYERHGFQPSPVDPMMLMIKLADVQRALTGGH